MMQKGPVVSVIIPTYNRALTIGRAIMSVLNQTYHDFEIIVIDDASTDNTKEKVNSLSDIRIKYISHSENKGAAAARNTGIKKAKGKYIAFLDSDDEWLPQKLKEQVNTIMGTTEKVGVVYTGTYRMIKDKIYYIPNPKIDKKEGDIYRNLLLGKYLIPTPSAMVKKSVFEKLGVFDETLLALEELDLWLRISKQFHFEYISVPLVISHYTEKSISTNRVLISNALFLIMKKHSRDFFRNKAALINILYRIIELRVGNLLHKMGLKD